jgi:hypothetical protein
MNVLFSLASYGLSDYEWYVLGGLAVSLKRMAAAGGSRASAAPQM